MKTETKLRGSHYMVRVMLFLSTRSLLTLSFSERLNSRYMKVWLWVSMHQWQCGRSPQKIESSIQAVMDGIPRHYVTLLMGDFIARVVRNNHYRNRVMGQEAVADKTVQCSKAHWRVWWKWPRHRRHVFCSWKTWTSWLGHHQTKTPKAGSPTSW